MGADKKTVEEYFRSNRDRQLRELDELLRIPSVSALSAHKGHIQMAAEWVAGNLKAAGLRDVEVMPTAGNPVVFAEWSGAEGAPTALIYGHYDVQPVDPVELWDSDPFTPTVRDGKLYARGASDDKGQAFMHIKAVEALLATDGKLPVNVKFLIEGEEEIGSPNLAAFVQDHKEKLAADLVVISDSALYAKGIPAICYGLRGLAALEVHLKGAKGDLHSGQYGGAVGNPLHVLAELIASLHDGQGKVAVDGFYDRVQASPDEERARLQALPFDEAAAKAELGVRAFVGEEGYTPVERQSIRPTLEVNGMWGGFQGEGAKTVLPSEAHAKITCRLVPDQDPDEIVALIERHLDERCHPSVTLTVEKGAGAKAWVCSPDEPALQATVPALKEAYGREPVFVRMGGSIPVVETFAALLGAPVVLMGFGLPGENLHAPNEHFHLENFDKGLRAIAHYWHSVSERQ